MAELPIKPEQPTDPERFRYGWRNVRRTRDDGTEETVQEPLTLLDVLHPREGDVIPENNRHERLRRHFQNVFEQRLAPRPTLLSLSDCLIDWGRDDLGNHSPDLIVLEREEPWSWGSWGTLHLRDEEARPVLAVEIVSPHTRANDVISKVDHYRRAGVPLYLIVDQEYDDGPLSLIGYRHRGESYGLMTPDARGRLRLEPMGVDVAVVGDRVALYDSATGEELGDYVAVCDALAAEVRARQAAERREQEKEQARAAAENARAAAENARAAAERREQEQEQARAEAERREREQAQARAAAERRAQEQTDALTAAEVRMKELEAELARLRGPAA